MLDRILRRAKYTHEKRAYEKHTHEEQQEEGWTKEGLDIALRLAAELNNNKKVEPSKFEKEAIACMMIDIIQSSKTEGNKLNEIEFGTSMIEIGRAFERYKQHQPPHKEYNNI